jgi:hypothetical protein
MFSSAGACCIEAAGELVLVCKCSGNNTGSVWIPLIRLLCYRCLLIFFMSCIFFNSVNRHSQAGNYLVVFGLLVSVLTLLLITCPSATSQPVTKTQAIQLKPEPMPFTAKEYYIASVADERKDRKAVAYLLTIPGSTKLLSAPQPVDLEGGGFPAIRQYITKSLPQNKKLRPVTVRLKECLVTESPADNGRIAGTVAMHMAFEWEREGEPVQLIEYKGGAQYNRSVTQQAAVERVLRQSIVSAVRYFDTWINKEADGNEKLAKAIKVTFTDYTENTENDTVFYSPGRPLIWDDFRDKPRVGRFAASVFPSFSYEGQSKVSNGIIHVNLAMKVYVLKNASWVRDNARDAYGLNHEQRHFDIVKLVAERFKKKIQPDSLTLEDYNSIIQYQYLESFREMNRLQEQYDGETGHGLNHAAQQKWNQWIDAELRSFVAKE